MKTVTFLQFCQFSGRFCEVIVNSRDFIPCQTTDTLGLTYGHVNSDVFLVHNRLVTTTRCLMTGSVFIRFQLQRRVNVPCRLQARFIASLPALTPEAKPGSEELRESH